MSAVYRAIIEFCFPAVLGSLPVNLRWKEWRSLSKDNDSYQWQKLFWMGIGMFSDNAAWDDRGKIDGDIDWPGRRQRWIMVPAEEWCQGDREVALAIGV